MNRLKNYFNTLIAAIYPNKCICCGEIIETKPYICDSCNERIERMNIDKLCLDCGLEVSDCVCKHSVFRFDSLICVFKNEGLAQKAYYSYKFQKKQHYAEFFAKQISDAVKKSYSNVALDVVCAVPSFKKFGFDHSGYIAKCVAQQLDLPFFSSLILCVKRGKKQHRSTFKERLGNVVGKYAVMHRIDGLKVLLIDDIKTTGATLDECTRELLFAGAQGVYCATVMGNVINSK